ncbi:MAG: hypothetical protein ABJQ14_24120, partial [Hyphomicrobiales bacterium]
DKWFQISRTMMEESANAVGTIWIGGVPELYHKGIETFFSDSEEGVVGFALAPEAPVDLQSMIRGYSEDPGAFLRVMRPRRTSHTEG